MDQSTTPTLVRQSTPHASLAAIGLKLQQVDLFCPIREQVHIRQKTVRHTPADKLYDLLIAMLAGAHGVVEVNTRLRSDLALQTACTQGVPGTACAEQSVIQQTLDACDATNVAQLEQALTTIYRQHSRGYQHAYDQSYQRLDVDMSGLVCGPKAAFATPGYCAKQRNRRGRQLGRVLATHYHEVVVDQLFPGTTQLPGALQSLIEAAAQTLELDAARRTRTIIRSAAGGGSLDAGTWLLERGYQVLVKEYSGKRARKLAASVTTWVADPQVAGRAVGWVTVAADEYGIPVVRIAVRCRKKHGQWALGVLIATLDPTTALTLSGHPPAQASAPDTVLLAYVYSYDRRGGGVETAIKDDKQGLGLGKRQKKRFAAQQMLTLLGTLAHTIVIWTRQWVAASAPPLVKVGVKRLVRDVFHVNGLVERDQTGRVYRIVLNQAHYDARRLCIALQALVGSEQVVISLGET